MKKKTKIIIGIVLVLVVLILAFFLFGRKGNKQADVEADLGIEYFNVEGVDQVFINGTVTPVRSEEFVKDPTLGKIGDLQVKNGDLVQEGTVLYQYIDPTSDAEISQTKMSIQNAQAERDKAARQRELELNQLASAGSTEEGIEGNTPISREAIDLKYDLNGLDIRIYQLNQQLNEILEKQVNKVTAPFTGKVSIPQEKNRDSAILKLISEDYFVVGTVNEKDVEKLLIDQLADIRTISSNKQLKGKITFISETPSVEAPAEAGGMSSGGTLSNYTVKLSLDNAVGLKNGFHVQAAVSLSDKKIVIPEKAIHFDKEQAYVLVDDFGTVLKKTIQLTEKKEALGKEVEVQSGLEAMDRIIVKSKKKLKDGDVLPTGDQVEPAPEGME